MRTDASCPLGPRSRVTVRARTEGVGCGLPTPGWRRLAAPVDFRRQLGDVIRIRPQTHLSDLERDGSQHVPAPSAYPLDVARRRRCLMGSSRMVDTTAISLGSPWRGGPFRAENAWRSP